MKPSRRCTSATGASTLDPETEVINTIGAKEGFSHLMWVLLAPGDAAVVPSPSYPIHIYGPLFAGAEIREIPMGMASGDIESGDDFFESLDRAFRTGWPRAPSDRRVSFPHNPTTACVDLAFMQRLVDFALEHEVVLVHDFAYADVGFDGYRPPSILQAEGAKDCAVELYSMTKSLLDGRVASGVPVGQRGGRRRAGEAEVAISTTARSSRSRSRPPSR